MYYNRARWYDPITSRFLSEDPLGFAGGDANLYRYAGNDPVNYRDPNGQFSIFGVLIASAITIGLDWLDQKINHKESNLTFGISIGVDSGGNVDASASIDNGIVGADVTVVHTSQPAFGGGQSDGGGTTGSWGAPSPLAVAVSDPFAYVGRGLESSMIATSRAMQSFNHDYNEYSGQMVVSGVEHFNQKLVNAGDYVGDHVSLAWLDPLAEAERAKASAINTAIGIRNFVLYTTFNPEQAASDAARAAWGYMDKITSDPDAAGEFLANYAFAAGEIAAGGVASKALRFLPKGALRNHIPDVVDNDAEAVLQSAIGVRSANLGIADESFVNLASPDRTKHILYGEGPGRGGHLWPGQVGQSPFPQDWSAERVMHEISDIAADPTIIPAVGNNGNLIMRGRRSGVDIDVIIARPGGWGKTPGGGIVTGYPTNVPRNP